MTHRSPAAIAAVREIETALLSTADLDSVLHLVCERAQELLGGDGASVAEYSASTRTLRCVAGSGVFEEAWREDFAGEADLNLRAISEGRVVIANQTPDASRLAVVRPDSDPCVSCCAIVAPLRIRGQVFGTLAVVNGARRPEFKTADAELLETLASLAGLAVDNARLLKAEHQRVEALERLRREDAEQIRILRGLHEAELAVSAGLHLDRVLQRVADQARELTGARYAAIAKFAPDSHELLGLVTSGVSGAKRAVFGETLPRMRGLLGEVMRSTTPIRLAHLAEDPRVVGLPPSHMEMDAFLGVAIRNGSIVSGNIYLTREMGAGEFSERDEAIVQMLASQAAVSIENARRYQELERVVQELKETQRQRDRFFAYVNHDLRNACSGVHMWTERLLREGEPPTREIARKIRQGSMHALRLVSDMLDLERMEQGRLGIRLRRIAVGELLQVAMEAMDPEAERTGLTMVIEPSTAGLQVIADSDRVLQIISNLLGNAVKFSPENSVVQISAAPARRPGDAGDETAGVAIQVTDSGPGIPPEDHERIFGEYEQVGEPEQRRGVGIGLTLSRRLARYLGGELSLDSEPGKGSTFTLWLPGNESQESDSGWIG